MEPAQTNTKKKVITGLVILVAIALLAIGGKALTGKDDATQNTAQTSPDTSASTSSDSSGSAGGATESTADTASSSYKDGTYTANGTYTSPGGSESIGVSVTLKDGVITDSSVQEGATDPEAREYQEDFISAYKSFVTGKDINSVRLSRVSGSSLTSNGFNRALDQIKQQAKA